MKAEQNERRKQLASDLAEVEQKFDADILAYVGPIFPSLDDMLLERCRQRKRRANVLLMLETPGGSADAAYRVARALQRCYPRQNGGFILYVHRYCKSAGTIVAMGSDRIIMAQEAQLGPIDVQLRKEDEVGERTSGLTPHQALDTLAGEANLHFRRFFRHFRYDNDLLFSTRLSAELASQMTIGLMGPIYEQIDPLRMGEIERFVRISSEYAERLRSPNVRPEAISRLAAAYPSHGFVIDREEAGEKLFLRVDRPSDALERIGDAVLSFADDDEPFIRYLNDEVSDTERGSENGEEASNKRAGRTRKGEASSEVRSNSAGRTLEPREPEAHGGAADGG